MGTMEKAENNRGRDNKGDESNNQYRDNEATEKGRSPLSSEIQEDAALQC